MVDWHEEDDPGADQAGKKGETPEPPTRVLELKLQVPTRWSSVWYMIERRRCCYSTMASFS